jgi:hypothetical protein
MKAYKAAVQSFDDFHKNRLAFGIQKALSHPDRHLMTLDLNAMIHDRKFCIFPRIET